MSLSLDFSASEQKRQSLTKEQQRQIQRLYESAAKDIAKKASSAPTSSSGAIRRLYLNTLKKQIDSQLEKIKSEIEGKIKGAMEETAKAVVEDSKGFLKNFGFSVEGAFSYVPADVIESIITGKLYRGNWTLSKALWNHNHKTQQDVQTVIANGIAQNKSAYEIAKDLEKYVDPTARKDWEWSKVYPGTNKKVDYNAQRLARTMVSHAYQQSFVQTTQKNPFVTKYKWLSSNSARVCPICASRDGQLYSKTELPLDHPNGMCTFVAVIEDSPEDIADRIADWALGKPDTELDVFANSLKGES